MKIEVGYLHDSWGVITINPDQSLSYDGPNALSLPVVVSGILQGMPEGSTPSEAAQSLPGRLNNMLWAQVLSGEKFNPVHDEHGRFGGRVAAQLIAGQEKIRESLSPKERDALEDYADSGYEQINGSLRGTLSMRGLDSEQRTSIEDQLSHVPHLDQALSRAAVPVDVVTYRVVGKGLGDILRDNMNPGGKVIDEGYVSTSIDRNFLHTFNSSAGSVNLQIRVKKGQSGLYIEPLFQQQNEALGRASQHELLLPRNSVFRKVGVAANGDLLFDYLGVGA